MGITLNPKFSSGRLVGQTLEASFTSDGWTPGQAKASSIQIDLNNTDAAGTLTLEASNDGANWVGVAFRTQSDNAVVTSISVTSGVDVDEIISPATDSSAAQYRVDYARTGGGASNTLSLYAVKKRY